MENIIRVPYVHALLKSFHAQIKYGRQRRSMHPNAQLTQELRILQLQRTRRRTGSSWVCGKNRAISRQRDVSWASLLSRIREGLSLFDNSKFVTKKSKGINVCLELQRPGGKHEGTTVTVFRPTGLPGMIPKQMYRVSCFIWRLGTFSLGRMCLIISKTGMGERTIQVSNCRVGRDGRARAKTY